MALDVKGFYRSDLWFSDNENQYNWSRYKVADNKEYQQSFVKISATVKSILDVRRVGKMDFSNPSKPRPIKVTSKNEFDRRVVMSCA